MKPNVYRLFELADEVEHFDLRSRGDLEPDSIIATIFTAAVKRFVGSLRRLDDAELLAELANLELAPQSIWEAQDLHADIVPIIDHLRDKISDPRLDDIFPPTKDLSDSTAKDSPGSKSERRRAVDTYIEEVLKETGKKISRKDFWKAAGYGTPSDFERWQRCDPKTTKAAKLNFARVLREKPHLKPR